MNPKTLGLIRHLLTTAGGMLVAFGLLNESELSQVTDAIIAISGGVMTLIGVYASWREKHKRLEKKF